MQDTVLDLILLFIRFEGHRTKAETATAVCEPVAHDYSINCLTKLGEMEIKIVLYNDCELTKKNKTNLELRIEGLQ